MKSGVSGVSGIEITHARSEKLAKKSTALGSVSYRNAITICDYKLQCLYRELFADSRNEKRKGSKSAALSVLLAKEMQVQFTIVNGSACIRNWLLTPRTKKEKG